MKRIWLALLGIGVLVSSGCGAKAQFKEFSSTEGRFKVQMPGAPKQTNQIAVGVNVTMFIVEERNGGFTVAFADLPLPSNESQAAIQNRLDGARDGMVNNAQATLTSSSHITLAGKYPGREIKADIPSKNGTMRARIYLVGGRLYQLIIAGTKAWVDGADTAKFLDSFALTK